MNGKKFFILNTKNTSQLFLFFLTVTHTQKKKSFFKEENFWEEKKMKDRRKFVFPFRLMLHKNNRKNWYRQRNKVP